MPTTKSLLFLTAMVIALPAAAEIDAAALWRQHCQRCHGADGSGQTAMGRRLQLRDYRDAAVQESLTDEGIVTATRDGVTKDNREVMPAYKEKMTEEQIAAMVGYIRSLRKE